jgi:hypothetical protein
MILAGLDFLLTPSGLGAGGERFLMNQDPGGFGLGVKASPLIVTADPIIEVGSLPDVVTAVLLTSEDVNEVGHSRKKSGADPKGSTPLNQMAGATRLELATFPVDHRDVLTNCST